MITVFNEINTIGRLLELVEKQKLSLEKEIIHDLKFGFKGRVFRDPLFSLDQKRVERSCNLIIENKTKIKFSIETRLELLSFSLIDTLSKARCSGINFGIEDIYLDILLRISMKPISLSLIKDIVNCCERKGIRTSCFFILDLPGSTKKITEETILFSKELFANLVEYKVATPHPCTDLYNMAKKNKWLLNESFDTLTGYRSSMQVSADLPINYLEKMSVKSCRDYYFSAKYLAWKVIKGRFLKNCYFALTSCEGKSHA